ncbi:hypothetical protein D3C87_607550 [compost metagenome]
MRLVFEWFWFVGARAFAWAFYFSFLTLRLVIFRRRPDFLSNKRGIFNGDKFADSLWDVLHWKP